MAPPWASGGLPLHPTLLAAAFVLNAAISAGVDARSVVRPFSLAVVVTLLLTVAASAAFRNRHVGGVAVTVVLGALLLPHAWSAVASVTARLDAWLSVVWLTALAVALVLAPPIVAPRARHWQWQGVTWTLNLFALALLGVVGLSAAASGAFGQVGRDLSLIAPPGVTGRQAAAAEVGPDVLVLLLDGYPRADTLERLFGVDNAPFLDALRERGFMVAERSRSNYTSTALTLTSMFHMRHLDQLPEYSDPNQGALGDGPRIRNLINDNPVFDQFRALGYRIVSIPPGIDRVSVRAADEVYEGEHLREFEFHLLRSTALGGLISLVDPAFLAREHRDRVVSAFERLEDVGGTAPGGRFIFAHVLKPHLPIVFRRDGSLIPAPYSADFFTDMPALDADELDEFTRSYADQLSWLNRRVLEAMNSVIAANPEAVIIVMADHGTATHFRWEDLDSDLAERFSTLFAARTPERSRVFSDDQTPINLFPHLFNAYFAGDYQLQPDTSFAGVGDFVAVPNPDAER